jgi:hypothetical protein
MDKQIINSLSPLHINEEDLDEEVCAFGQKGLWLNKNEVRYWQSNNPDISLNDYKLNEDTRPDLITKTIHQPVEYKQDIQVKYLKPPTPPPHGDLIIRQENDIILPKAPPQILRQLAPRQRTPEPLIIRERPPPMPVALPEQIITIPGRVITSPNRQVVIERMPNLPAKPQPIIIEKWLPYEKQKRRVIYQTTNNLISNNNNLIIQLNKPNNSYIDWDCINKYSNLVSNELKLELEKLRLSKRSDLFLTRHYLDSGSGFRVLLDRPINVVSDFNDLEGDLEPVQQNNNNNNYKLGNDYSKIYSFTTKKTTSKF